MTSKNVFLSFLAVCLTFMPLVNHAQINPDSIVVYDRAGQQVSFSTVLEATQDKKYVFFGELHGVELAHEAELLLLKRMHDTYGDRLLLGMEMFEMDVQYVMDEYLTGLINQRSFETESRVWNNYTKDYKPLVEYAKENGLQVVASNVPRRYANSVYHQGVEVLSNMSRSAKKNFPKLPLKVNYDLPSYRAMATMLPDHSADNFIASQALKDATMAMNIDRFMSRNKVMFHVHGAYHSANWEGIIPYLKRVREGELLLITTVMQAENGEVDPAVFEKADYTIVSPIQK